MNGIPGLTQPLAAAGKRIDHWDDTGGRLRVSASSSVTWSICPKGTCRSHQVHGRYHRNLADRSCFGCFGLGEVYTAGVGLSWGLFWDGWTGENEEEQAFAFACGPTHVMKPYL